MVDSSSFSVICPWAVVVGIATTFEHADHAGGNRHDDSPMQSMQAPMSYGAPQQMRTQTMAAPVQTYAQPMQQTYAQLMQQTYGSNMIGSVGGGYGGGGLFGSQRGLNTMGSVL